MGYQVPQNIVPDKYFFVNRSEIKGRLDPKMALYNKIVQHALFPMVKLKNLLLSKPQYGANEAGLDRLNNTQPRYIRITDIDENGLISINELGATVANVEEKYILKDNDILIARSGATVGKAYIHKNLPYTCLYAGYLIRFLVNPQIILPDYLFFYTQLNSYKEWVNAIQRPSAQPNINAEEYQSLDIPLPDLSKQTEIVDFLSEAYLNKQQKEQQAETMLNGIDDYLLGELGVALPQDNKNKTFLVGYNDIIDDRWDPYYHKPYFSAAFERLKGKYDLYTIKQVSSLITSGITPLSGGDAYTDREEGVAFIRSGDIDINGDIDFEKLLYIKPSVHNFIMQSSQVRKNDIMIAIVGATIGRIGIYYSDKPANINQAIALVRLKANFLPDYVKEVLQSSIGQLNLDKMKRPVARANINLEEIGHIIIPIPSLDKQQEIINHISEMRAQAKLLQAEGAEILQKAKLEVERIILGSMG